MNEPYEPTVVELEKYLKKIFKIQDNLRFLP